MQRDVGAFSVAVDPTELPHQAEAAATINRRNDQFANLIFEGLRVDAANDLPVDWPR